MDTRGRAGGRGECLSRYLMPGVERADVVGVEQVRFPRWTPLRRIRGPDEDRTFLAEGRQGGCGTNAAGSVRGREHPCVTRVDRKGRETSAESRHGAVRGMQRTEIGQSRQRVLQSLRARRHQPGQGRRVFDARRFEEKNPFGKVGSQDLRNLLCRTILMVLQSPKPHRVSGGGAACSASPLIR